MLLHASAHPALRGESNLTSKGLPQCTCAGRDWCKEQKNKKKKEKKGKNRKTSLPSTTHTPQPRILLEPGFALVVTPGCCTWGCLLQVVLTFGGMSRGWGAPRTSEGGLQGPRMGTDIPGHDGDITPQRAVLVAAPRPPVWAQPPRSQPPPRSPVSKILQSVLSPIRRGKLASPIFIS